LNETYKSILPQLYQCTYIYNLELFIDSTKKDGHGHVQVVVDIQT